MKDRCAREENAKEQRQRGGLVALEGALSRILKGAAHMAVRGWARHCQSELHAEEVARRDEFQRIAATNAAAEIQMMEAKRVADLHLATAQGEAARHIAAVDLAMTQGMAKSGQQKHGAVVLGRVKHRWLIDGVKAMLNGWQHDASLARVHYLAIEIDEEKTRSEWQRRREQQELERVSGEHHKAYEMQQDELEILAEHLQAEKSKEMTAAARHFGRWRGDRFAELSREVVHVWRGHTARFVSLGRKVCRAGLRAGTRTHDNLCRELLRGWSERCRATGFARRLSLLLVDCCSLEEAEEGQMPKKGVTLVVAAANAEAEEEYKQRRIDAVVSALYLKSRGAREDWVAVEVPPATAFATVLRVVYIRWCNVGVFLTDSPLYGRPLRIGPQMYALMHAQRGGPSTVL